MNKGWRRCVFLVTLGVLLIGANATIASNAQDGPDPTDDGPCADVPGEVAGVLLDGSSTLTWDGDSCAVSFNVYRGTLSELALGQPAKCHGRRIASESFTSPADPGAGGYFYLVTALGLEEGTPGFDSSSAERPLLGSCDTTARQHVLNRLGFGWNEWTRDRVAVLGLQSYIAEQLAPALIDESTNAELNNLLLTLEPPTNIQSLQGVDLARAVYGRRQLEQAVTIFWTNHFNTDYGKSFMFFNFYNPDADRKRLEATTLHYREMGDFRTLAFNGSFRQIVDASANSAAMIIYLDTKDNRVGNPNENYPRELLELHTMGVDGGYTDFDIVELARVFTGWNVCKKEFPFVDDPLGPCIPGDMINGPNEPDGLWVANFRPEFHDCHSKVLFQGTPEDTLIPDTCVSPQDGVNDAQLALDAIAAHPSTTRFVSKKLLEKFVTEQPTTEMIDNVVAVWGMSGNPSGVGDLRAVLTEVLSQAEFLDPDGYGTKVKTPFEHVSSAFRAVRGLTNGTSQVRNFLQRMDHLLHQNPVPTGYPEDGASWLDTNNTLERHNFGADMSNGGGVNFGSDVITMMQANGISTAPGNAGAIVDFLSDAMFGSAISLTERQDAIDFLETDDSGNPDPGYNNTRIRETVGFLLGYPQFQEQ